MNIHLTLIFASNISKIWIFSKLNETWYISFGYVMLTRIYIFFNQKRLNKFCWISEFREWKAINLCFNAIYKKCPWINSNKCISQISFFEKLWIIIYKWKEIHCIMFLPNFIYNWLIENVFLWLVWLSKFIEQLLRNNLMQ